MKPAQNHVLLEIHVPDFQKVKDFYGKLGFRVVWERKPEEKKGYLVMERDQNILCFWLGNEFVWKQEYFSRFPSDTKRGYGIEIVVMVEEIEKVYDSIKLFANVVEELKIKPWGLKDFRIEDPFGYYIRITEPHNILDPHNAVP